MLGQLVFGYNESTNPHHLDKLNLQPIVGLLQLGDLDELLLDYFTLRGFFAGHLPIGIVSYRRVR